MTKFTNEAQLIDIIAETGHEQNRGYCSANGDTSQPTWGEAPEWQRLSMMNGAKFHIENPNALDSDAHDNWAKEKTEAGWVYGEVKDVDAKTHPCLVPFDELGDDQRLKDILFRQTARAIIGVVGIPAGEDA